MRRLVTLAVLLIALPAMAQDKKDPPKEKPKALPRIALREPTEVAKDADYAIQGEYEGTVTLDGGEKKVGAQVVAKGQGSFSIRVLIGGLPGAGWDGKTQLTATAKTYEGKVVTSGGDFLGSIGDGKLSLQDPTKINGTLKRVERKSPTLGAKPPEGAVVLFGKSEDVETWNDAEIAKLSDGEFLSCKPGKNILSKQAFKSGKIHLEFRLAWMPNSTGQGRSNSGLYIQNLYECQMLDSFALKGENNECGGFYTQHKPSVNMCLPPMVWQTYDIEFTAAKFDGDKRTDKARVTMFHNGVKIHDNIELPGPTPGGQKDESKAGPLHLQWHGDPLVYRNIWVVGK
jgi:3-keto-disaccharide hydrolase